MLGIPSSVAILTGLLSALFILARKLSCSKKSSVLEFTINLVNHMQVVDFVGKFEDLKKSNLDQETTIKNLHFEPETEFSE